MLLLQEKIKGYNKFRILILLMIVIIWRISANGDFLRKDLLTDFTNNVFERISEIVNFMFEIIGFFVIMIVLGEILRRLYRIIIQQISALKREEQEKMMDQETLNISIILSISLLIYSIF